jgi:hypothetical protein
MRQAHGGRAPIEKWSLLTISASGHAPLFSQSSCWDASSINLLCNIITAFDDDLMSFIIL